jgi:TrpR-related protein YerC/YecD
VLCYHANTMSTTTASWRSPASDDLCDAFLCMRTRDEVASFLRDVCTLSELEAMSHRLQVARLVDAGEPYLEVAARVGCSTTTVTRVAQWLRHGEGGYRLALDRLRRRQERAR